jgi:hypothetical protein
MNDILDYCGINMYINKSDLSSFALYLSPGHDYLIDSYGLPLSCVSVGLDLYNLGDEAIWYREDTSPIFMALDKALQAHAKVNST